MKVKVEFEVPVGTIKEAIKEAATTANNRVDVPGVPEAVEAMIVDRCLEAVYSVIDNQLPELLSRVTATVSNDLVKVSVTE